MSPTGKERRRQERPDTMIERYMTTTFNIMRKYQPHLFQVPKPAVQEQAA